MSCVRADDVGVIGMIFRKQLVVERFFDQPIGRVLGGLAPLVAHDVALVGEPFLVELAEQIAHAIAFEPQRELKLVGGQSLEVVGAIEVGGAVDVARARRLQILIMHLRADVLRAFEHHVLEQVGETGAPGALVGRADVVPEIDGDQRQPVVLARE